AADFHFNGRNFVNGGVKLCAGVVDRLVNRFAKNRVGEIAAAHVQAAATSSGPATADAQKGSAGTRGFAGTRNGNQDFSGRGVNHARAHAHHRFRFTGAHAAKPESAQAIAAAAHIGVLIVAAKLRDRANDDAVHAEDLPDLCGGCRVGAVAIGKILFGENLIERVPLNHRVFAVLHQFLDQQIGNTFADVLIGAKD